MPPKKQPPTKKTTTKKVPASVAKKNQSKVAKLETIEQILAAKKAVIKKVPVQVDGALASELEDLRADLREAKDLDPLTNAPAIAPGIESQIAALEEQSKDTIRIFTFKSIGRFNYDEIVAQHQPTKEQKAKGGDFNEDTFPPIIVAASCVDPEITLEQAEQMFSSPDWNGTELNNLFMGAVNANIKTGDIPLSNDESGSTLTSLLNLLTPQDTESLIRSI